MKLLISTVLYKTPVHLLVEHLEAIDRSVCYTYSENETLDVWLFLVDNSMDIVYQLEVEAVVNNFKKKSDIVIRYCNSKSNLGYGGGHNLIGLAENSDYSLFLNPDTILEKEALFKAVEWAKDSHGLFVVSPQISGSYEKVPHVAKRYPSVWVFALRYLRFFKSSTRLSRYVYADIDTNKELNVELVGGCFLFMPSSLFKSLGGFDKAFFMYFEDFDLCLRARKLGADIVYLPSVKVRHDGGGVSEKAYYHHWWFFISAVKFFSKHKWRLIFVGES